MIFRSLTVVLVLFAGASAIAGQGAHYTYPFSIACPDGVVPAGETVSVVAKFDEGLTGERYLPTFNWTTSNGAITGGQGTAAISIEIDKWSTGTVHVTLERVFGEAHFPGVQRQASCSIEVVPRPVARMTDEFRTAGANCEEGFARLDGFFVELNNDPIANALIVLYGDTRDAGALRRREQQLINHFRFRRFPRDRVTMVHGAARENGTTQFWLVPPGADMPEMEKAPDLVKKPPTQPYLYAANYMDGVPGCSGHLYDVGEYASELKSLPGSRGRIIISEPSRAKFNRTLQEVTTELAAAGIPRNRFTAVYKYVRPNRLLEVTELWVIP